MSAPSNPQAEPLAIRSAPAPVRRFSKTALAVVLGGASAIVFGSFAFAMKPGAGQQATAPRELYSTANKPKADGLAALPVTYRDLPNPRPAPELGPPLPGDLGGPILRAQRSGRLSFQGDGAGAPVGVQDPLTAQAAEAEAAAQARAVLARESGLFFSVSTRGPVAGPDISPVSRPAAGNDPYALLASLSDGTNPATALPDQNRQMRKEAFASAVPDTSIYNPHQLETPVSPWQVMAGTVIPATLLTGVNSDLPGQVIAQVTEPVYDTVTGQTVLIPQGSRVMGRYDSVIAYGQSRALIVWSRIILPDGSSIRIENLPAVDARGMAGLSDRVNLHSLRIFSAAALSSLISIGAELAEDDDETVGRALRDALQDGASRAGDAVVRRQLSVQPTLTVRPGWRLRILVHQDIILRPYRGD